MTREQEFLLTVLTKAVKGEPVRLLPEDIRWDAFVQEAKQQAVWVAAYDALEPVWEQIPIDREAAEMDAMTTTLSNLTVERTQQELVSELEAAECPYVILKGLSAAAAYPKPQIRQLGDVDFIVPPEWMDTVALRMEKQGYEEIFKPNDHHRILKKTDGWLEMHEEVAGVPKECGREQILDFLQTVYECRKLEHTQLGSFYAPAPSHQAMILLLHMRHHIVFDGIGLRHVMDWACFMNRYAQEDFWQDVVPVLRQAGLFYFVAVMSKLCTIYLGSDCPQWASEADETVCRDMMEDILAGGNFGRKDSRRALSTSLFPDWENSDHQEGKLGRMWRSLRRVVQLRYPRVKNQPVTVFFLMIYRGVRHLFFYCLGKRERWGDLAEIAKEREAVYNRLRMFEKGDEN